MKEIGGYIELDRYRLPMYHENAIALNCGRNALAYLIKARGIKRLWIPRLICSSVPDVCEREGISYSFYGVGKDLLPAQNVIVGDEEWFYFVNYYSQFDNKKISDYVKKYSRVIVDNAQSYFQEPIPGVDSIYTCRKYFGVTDGAFLYTDTVLEEEIPVDESFDRMVFLLGRFERSAVEFYDQYIANNDLFYDEPIKRMSLLTNNLLHAIDYDHAERTRRSNYALLHSAFEKINLLKLNNSSGTFMYPLKVMDASRIRKNLIADKIYIPTLWPDVFDACEEESDEYGLARDILPLPIDQRYTADEMYYIVNAIRRNRCDNE